MVPGPGVIRPFPWALCAPTQPGSVSLSLRTEVTAQRDTGWPPRARWQGCVTFWETGCGTPRSRQRIRGSGRSSAAPPGLCGSPPRPGADIPPPSAAEGGSGPAWNSAPSCQGGNTSYCPPGWGGTSRVGPQSRIPGQELSGQNPWGRTTSQGRIPGARTLRQDELLSQDHLPGQEFWGRTSFHGKNP